MSEPMANKRYFKPNVAPCPHCEEGMSPTGKAEQSSYDYCVELVCMNPKCSHYRRAWLYCWKIETNTRP